jgi:hypothetical protein
MRRWVILSSATILTFCIGFAVYSLLAKRAVRFSVFPLEPSVAFQPDAQNQGKQCRAIYYGLGSGDGAYDPHCYDLQTKLSEAAWNGDIEKIKELLRAGANADSQAGDHGYSLDSAVLHGQTKAAHLLLDNGASLNHSHPIRGNTLLRAVESGNPETVELLLSRGADVTLGSGGYTALKLARERKSREIIELLERAGAKR